MALMTDCGLLESSTPRAGGRLQRVPSPPRVRIFISVTGLVPIPAISMGRSGAWRAGIPIDREQ